LETGFPAFADQGEKDGALSKGDAVLLRFAAAAEIIESDFWIQYNELGGIQDTEDIHSGLSAQVRRGKLAGQFGPFARFRAGSFSTLPDRSIPATPVRREEKPQPSAVGWDVRSRIAKGLGFKY
jgi:hypothetical protein